MGLGDALNNGKTAGKQAVKIAKDQVLINLHPLCR
jgi:hypothetical protein